MYTVLSIPAGRKQLLYSTIRQHSNHNSRARPELESTHAAYLVMTHEQKILWLCMGMNSMTIDIVQYLKKCCCSIFSLKYSSVLCLILFWNLMSASGIPDVASWQICSKLSTVQCMYTFGCWDCCSGLPIDFSKTKTSGCIFGCWDCCSGLPINFSNTKTSFTILGKKLGLRTNEKFRTFLQSSFI